MCIACELWWIECEVDSESPKTYAQWLWLVIGTPLIKKLGIQNDTKVLLLHAPDNYFELLGTILTGQLCKKKKSLV